MLDGNAAQFLGLTKEEIAHDHGRLASLETSENGLIDIGEHKGKAGDGEFLKRGECVKI